MSKNSNMANAHVFKSGIKVIESFQIWYPLKILSVCRAISSKMIGNEFTILVKSGWNEGHYELTNEYVIPPQRVTSSAVEYVDKDGGDDNSAVAEFMNEGYNTLIHCHPWVNSGFSNSDQTTTNLSFPCAMLFSHNESGDPGFFTDATLSFMVEGTKFRIPVNGIYFTNKDESTEVDMSPIKETVFVSQFSGDISKLGVKTSRYFRLTLAEADEIRRTICNSCPHTYCDRYITEVEDCVQAGVKAGDCSCSQPSKYNIEKVTKNYSGKELEFFTGTCKTCRYFKGCFGNPSDIMACMASGGPPRPINDPCDEKEISSYILMICCLCPEVELKTCGCTPDEVRECMKSTMGTRGTMLAIP